MYIRQAPSNTTALEGTEVTLACRAEAASAKNISYQWYRNDVNVHHAASLRHDDDDDDDDDEDLDGRLSVYPDGCCSSSSSSSNSVCSSCCRLSVYPVVFL